MGAKDITELVCWQLARELNLFVGTITARPAVIRNRRFWEQLDAAGSSSPRNIAEGFGRYDHKEAAQFIKIALGSEQETINNIIEAFDKGFISVEERDAGLRLARRAIGAATKFRQYLVSTPTPRPPKPQPPKFTPVPPADAP